MGVVKIIWNLCFTYNSRLHFLGSLKYSEHFTKYFICSLNFVKLLVSFQNNFTFVSSIFPHNIVWVDILHIKAQKSFVTSKCFLKYVRFALIWFHRFVLVRVCLCRLCMTQTPCMCSLRVTTAEVCGSRALKRVSESSDVSTEKAADHTLKVQLWTAAWLSSATNHTYASGVTHESKFSVTAAIFTVAVARLCACTMRIASMRTKMSTA